LLLVEWQKDYRGPIWSRCVVRLPKDWLGQRPLQLRLEPGSSLRVWLNGHEATMTEANGNTYQFAASSVMVDDANLLVMRRETADGLLQLPEAPVLLSGPLQFSLKGRWEVRLGDDQMWSNIPLPAKFGGSTDAYFEPR
jgi:hypothetical protein